MSAPGSIVHVVLTEWRDDAPAEVLEKMRADVGRFVGEIPGVVDVVEGSSASVEGLEAGFEWALVVTFASVGARDGYLDHPAHTPVAEVIGRWAERLVVFDVAA
ncbi:Dabb family protein [Demequina sp. TTPB684]|uniref:Dabb family protein n=1 Tax=unclassified Demequina TaxID=2620311 RepID=UPI001CF5BFCC|nr:MULTISPECIES: Dabb family protein [unclassified Demequina]MCB2412416.1 Dabb family protein [Demequina sp. TTPB684]UPU89500.1 Dabb family protein [Demequina sp. TMPB413]